MAEGKKKKNNKKKLNVAIIQNETLREKEILKNTEKRR